MYSFSRFDCFDTFSGSLKNNFDKEKVQNEIDLQVKVTKEFRSNVQDFQVKQNKRKDELKAKLEQGEISQADYDAQVSRIQKQSLLVNMLAGGLTAPSDSVLGIATSTVSPAVSYEIGQYFKQEGKEGSFEHIATHAVLGALTSAANGGNALSGAVSAGGAEYIAQKTAQTLFKKDADELTADEKQTVSSIAQIVGTVSGSLNGDTSLDAYVGNTVATNAVENNYLTKAQKKQRAKELAECKKDFLCKGKVYAKYEAIDVGQDGAFGLGFVAGIPTEIWDAASGLVGTIAHPIDTYNAMKTLIANGELDDAIKQDYINRINRLESEYQRGGTGAYFAGLESGKLFTEVATLFVGGEVIAAKTAGTLGKAGKVAKVAKTADKSANTAADATRLEKKIEINAGLDGEMTAQPQNMTGKFAEVRKVNIGTKIDDKVVLAEKQDNLSAYVSETFRNGQYTTVVTNENVTLYRTFGGGADQAKLNSGYATTETGLGRQELALYKKWSDTRFEAEIVVPKGETLNIGKVGEQPVGGKVNGTYKYRGGADQILLPRNWDTSWVKSVKDKKTGITYSLKEFKQKFPDQIK